MRLDRIHTEKSSESAGCLRTTATMRFDNHESIVLWVEYPSELEGGISRTANPWIVAMLPEAMSRGEDIESELPVDPVLAENVLGVEAVWSSWYPELQQTTVRAPAMPRHCEVGGRTGTFFSGGIDSYYSIARRLPGNEFGIPVVGTLDDLVTVWGFDVGANDEASFRPLARALGDVANAIPCPHWIVRTNLRQVMTTFRRRWGPLTFAAGLAFIALFFERRFGQFVLGSSYPFGHLVPWGSHPLVDPLFSTSALRIVHDGASYGRLDKTRLVGRWPLTGRLLHVCQGTGAENCSNCEKCLRTMVTIDVLGFVERFAKAFDWSSYGPERIKSLYVGDGPGTTFYFEILDEAERAGRKDIESALHQAIKRSKSRAPLLALCDALLKVPFLYRLGLAGEARLLDGMVSARYIDHTKVSRRQN